MKNPDKIIFKNKVALLWLLIMILSISTFAYTPQYSDDLKNVKLRWKNNTIKIGISNSLLKTTTNFKNDTDVSGAIKRSLEHWENVANIQFVDVQTDKQTVNPKGGNGDGINLVTIAATPENILLFSDNPTEIAARTRVFFNHKGYITEADIVLNPYLQFSTDGTFGTFDLESTITHEIGHLLGLEHSFVIGSTMQANQPRNGIYGMPAFNSRTLAEDDIVDVRGLYGSKTDDCCGSLSGKLANKNLIYFWLEDIENGSISAGFSSKPDGSFRVDGLLAGKYRLLAQDRKIKSSVEDLGEVFVEKGKMAIVEKLLKFNTKSFEISHIGFNSQLTNTAVPINGGKSFMIFVGGSNINTKDYEISFDSPYIKINRQSLLQQDFGDDISICSFEIEVNSRIPFGDYVVKIKKQNGETDYLIGGLSVDSVFVNNWNSKLLNIGEE
jgi:hypothetical protein